MHERGDRPAAAVDPRHRAADVAVGQVDRAPMHIDVARRLREPVGDLKRIVAERTRETFAQPPRFGGLVELDDQIGDAEPSETAAKKTDEKAQRHAAEGGDLEVVQPDTRADRTGVVRGRSRRDQRERHDRDAKHRHERATQRRTRAAEPGSKEDESGGGSGDRDPALVAVQARRHTRIAVDQQQVARERGDGQRHQLQHRHVEPGRRDRHPLEPRMQMTLRIGQERLRERRLRQHRGERPGREENGHVRGLEQGQQPERAVRDQIEPDPVLRPTPPRHIAADEERPRCRQRQRRDRCLVDRVVADGD